MDKTLLGLMMIFFVAFTVFMTYVVFNKQFTSAARASNQTISAEKSLMFAWPLEIAADAKEKATVTVFIRDDEGKAMADKTVRVQSTLGTLSATAGVTDKGGKALFQIVSDTSGVAEIQAVVDNTPIRRKISVKFN